MEKKISLKDIANEVGVSIALVSYVLNGKEKEARVGKEMAEKIRKAARELNYQPNQIARSLKSGKTHTLGLIVADISNPFFASLARTIEDEASKKQYTVIIGSSDENSQKLNHLIEVLLERQVDGLIIVPTADSKSQVVNLIDRKIPFVLVDRYFQDVPANCVSTDNYQAAYNAVVHLIKAGYKKIGMVAYNIGLVHMQERERGYKDAMKDHGLLEAAPEIGEVGHNTVKEDVEQIIKTMIAGKTAVNALFFATNTLAINGLKCLNKMNLKIPDDVAVVTFDQGEVFDFFYSPLTYVKQPIEKMGVEAVNLLFEAITGTAAGENRQVCMDSELIIRSSSISGG